MASEKKPKDPTPDPVQTVSISARAHLECTAGPEKGQRLRVAPNVTLIGRDAACDVILSETAISRQHVRIERRPDRWLLRNLSANGTLLNKKPVDEAALADGDEIRVGAKTRLRFVVEEVALSASGRPQFRRRAAPKEDEAAEPDKPAAEGEEPTKPSLFKRRKNLFIGLGIYLALILIVAVALALRGGGLTGGSSEIPVLLENDVVIPGPGQRPLRILHEVPEGIRCEDATGQPVLVAAEKFASGEAKRIPGIRSALDIKFNFEANPTLAEQGKKEAIELYRVRYLPGRASALYSAVRKFQQALGYSGGRGYFETPAEDKIYQDALKELIDIIKRDYSQAVLADKRDDYRAAWDGYQNLLRLVPDRENPIYRNVAVRADRLKRLHEDLK
jgi:hypothetical protein